uniref:RanBP2-type domain-containing protein n=1 Tax=Urocitellus parryii TaxID=9999 RepID=A0A8D2KL81_UROPR
MGTKFAPTKKCGNVNFARRTSYNRCGREKTTEAKMMKARGTEIGKTLAEKSRGLFSANEWQCKTCSNVNWARRSDCKMCNIPKYAKLEERTGYGDGFNERENVEYIEREESDGEYDEFGCKKKKCKGKAVGPASILKEVENKQSEGEEMRMRMKMMLISQNIILMPVKKKIVIKRNLIDEVAQSLDLHIHNLHHAHYPPQVQGLDPGPIQEVLPVRSQNLIQVPENVQDLEGRNQDPALGPTGPHEKDLIQVHHLLRGTEREVVLDLLHLPTPMEHHYFTQAPQVIFWIIPFWFKFKKEIMY